MSYFQMSFNILFINCSFLLSFFRELSIAAAVAEAAHGKGDEKEK